MAEELYDPSWDAADAPARPGNGLAGLGSGSKNILSDTEGFFGFSILKATNVIFNVLAPPGATTPIRDLLLTITYPGQAQPEVITYSAAYVYERTLPESTLITAQTTGGQYVPQTVTFTVKPNTTQTVTIQLAFTQGYALSSRGVWA